MKNNDRIHQAVSQPACRGLALLLFGTMLAPQALANDEFLQWKQQQAQSFQEYKDKRDKEFTAFLKMHWTEMQLLKGFERDPAPKPVVMPVATPEPMPVTQPETPVAEPVAPPAPVAAPVIIVPVPVPAPVPVAPPPVKPTTAIKGRRINFSFYGTPVTLYYDDKLKTSLAHRIDKNAVSGFWSALSKADYDALIDQLEAQRTALQLNDWAYVLLVNETANQVYPGAQNQQSLFTWFILAKAGYKARIAYDDRTVYLLVPSNQQLYSTPYFTFDNLRYYAVRFDGSEQKLGRVFTYDGEYPGTNKQLDMVLNRDMVVTDHPARRKLSFEFEGRRYEIDAAYDIKRVDFLNTYPQLDLDIYFSSNVSSTAASPLLQQLSADMQGMSQQQAVNFLLRFVQSSLKYKTDESQFGKENYLFPEETLYYPYSDCEDRSILFAWLVKQLLGLEVVGLDYPGHVATAVQFTDKVNGDAITYQGKRYVVADPTYVNASAGTTMPEYINSKPKIIRIQ